LFLVPPPWGAGLLVAPSTGPRPPWPREYAATSPANCALHSDPDRRRLSPLHRTVPWSTGSQPPVPPSPASSCGVQKRRPPSAPWERADSGGPRATGASAAAMGWPGGATASHTRAGLWHRRRHSTGPTPQPPAASGWLCPAVAGQPARHMLAPSRPSHGRPPVPPTTSAVADSPHRRSPPSPRRRGRPRRRRA
jgi:hypothetical protein